MFLFYVQPRYLLDDLENLCETEVCSDTHKMTIIGQSLK